MSKVKRAIYIQLVSVLGIGLLFFLIGWVFPLADWVAGIQQKVTQMGSWSALWYVLLYVCCNVLLLPGGILSFGGGFFFGLWWGFLIILIGNVGAAGIAFLISRRIGRRWLRSKLANNKTLGALEPAVEREGWKIVLLSQLHPLFPTSLLNYLYGLTTIKFRTCILWVAIGQAPGLFLYAYLGTLGQLGLNLAIGKTHPRFIEYITWGGGLVLSAAILILLGRVSLRLLQEVDRRDKGSVRQRSQPPQVKPVEEDDIWRPRSFGTH
jgi:uncharacterized membrane protein YdjX (TVP38/TMEM64 family)